MKTFSTTPTDIEREWFVVDAEGQVLGRLATQVASILRGKQKPYFAPHLDTGDNVIIVNAANIRVTGNKLEQKVYTWYTGWPGGLRTISLKDRMAKEPDQVVRGAIKGMLPRGPLGRQTLRKLHVYAGSEHPHAAQQPKPLNLE
ncbi:50S ribosomal protein L13 [Gemmatimonadota bacterium]